MKQNDASATEQFYKLKLKQFLKFKFDCNPLTVSQNIAITSYFSYTYKYDPLIFDLMILTSNQFIGSARYIQIYIHTCPDFDRNLSIRSNDVITSYFCIDNEPCDL